MARRDDGKDAALAASRTLNGDPRAVTDPAFAAGGFFDPADLLQVKYEMVRQVEVDGVPVSAAAAAFGFARQSVYNARAALAAGGLAALIPGKPGPKGGHKLTGPVLDHLEALLEQDPRLTFSDLAAQAAQDFGRCTRARCAGRWNGGLPAARPGTADRRRPKAADGGSLQPSKRSMSPRPFRVSRASKARARRVAVSRSWTRIPCSRLPNCSTLRKVSSIRRGTKVPSASQ
jgi:transposase-like protein